MKDLTPARIADELVQRLHQFQDPAHAEGRNRSLLASLDFSRGRLSARARDALPWLGWFQGGMFEAFFLDFSEIPASDWSAIRAELVATALLRVEDLPEFNSPYLKLHPTLADAASAEPAAGYDTRAGRFVDVYLNVRGIIANALGGSQPAAGMALTRLELANLRRALDLAVAAGRHLDGWALGNTLRDFLERAGRLRERGRLVERVRAAMPADRLDPAACAAIRDHAWSLFTRGQAQQALDAVQDVERRLGAGGGASELVDGDTVRELAKVRLVRGRILCSAGRPDLALAPLGQAIDALRALAAAERAGDLALQGALTQRLGILQRDTGRTAASVDTLKQALRLLQQAGNRGGEMRTCELLGTAEQMLGRLDPAEAWYRKALGLAEQLGDQQQVDGTRHNLGILFQTRAEALPADDPAAAPERARWLAAAVAEIEASLAITQQRSDRLGAASSHHQLSVLHRLRGDLDRAEAEARQALAIWEPLGHPETRKVYAILADIARARAVHHARTAGQRLPPDAAEALAQLAGLPAPLGDLGAFLQAVAGCQTPAPPALCPSRWTSSPTHCSRRCAEPVPIAPETALAQPLLIVTVLRRRAASRAT